MAVSAATETKLREAMARLLAGEPLHTDGALTKENLAREAKVSHATVHRAEEVLAEWDAKVTRPILRTPGEVQRDETIADLRKQLREAKAQVTELQGRFDALAAVAANLYAENLALKKKLGSSRRLASVPAPAPEPDDVRTDG
jgi:predicted RNase H-like nuclease (RuvC/YqgF family)